MKDLNQLPILNLQLMKMNKPKRQSSKLIRELQEKRTPAEFEKTKKRMLLAARIQDAIKAKGLSYKQFALMMDQYESVVSKWLSGTHNFTADTLFDIEEKLGIKLVSFSEVETIVVERKYIAIVQSGNKVSLPNLHGAGVFTSDKEGAVHIAAKVLGINQVLGLPLLKKYNYDC